MPRFRAWPERVAKCICISLYMQQVSLGYEPLPRQAGKPATASAFTIKQFPLNLVTSLAICYARQQSYVTLCHKFMRQPRLPLFSPRPWL